MAINTNMNVATLKDAKQIAIRVDSLNNYSTMNKNNDITKKTILVGSVVLNGNLDINVMKNHF
jgi:hypothetical protein